MCSLVNRGGGMIFGLGGAQVTLSIFGGAQSTFSWVFAGRKRSFRRIFQKLGGLQPPQPPRFRRLCWWNAERDKHRTDQSDGRDANWRYEHRAHRCNWNRSFLKERDRQREKKNLSLTCILQNHLESKCPRILLILKNDFSPCTDEMSAIIEVLDLRAIPAERSIEVAHQRGNTIRTRPLNRQISTATLTIGYCRSMLNEATRRCRWILEERGERSGEEEEKSEQAKQKHKHLRDGDRSLLLIKGWEIVEWLETLTSGSDHDLWDQMPIEWEIEGQMDSLEWTQASFLFTFPDILTKADRCRLAKDPTRVNCPRSSTRYRGDSFAVGMM